MTSQRRGWGVLRDGRVVRAAEPRIPAGVGVGTWLWCWIAGNALSIPLIARWGPAPGGTIAVWLLALTSAVSWTVFVAGIVVVSRWFGTGRFVDDFGMRGRRRDVLGVGVGVVVQLVVVPLVYVPLRVWWPDVFTDHRLTETAQGMVDGASGAWLVVLVVMIAVGAPVVEELVYRGLVQGSIANRFSDGAAWVLTAVLFTAIHFRPYEYPGLLVLSLVVGAAAMWTRRLGMAVMIHVGFNATGLAVAYL